MIKKADIQDASKLKDFMLKIIKDDFGYEFNPVWHKDIAEMIETYFKPNSAIFFIEQDDEVLGTIALRPYDKSYPEFRDRYNSSNTISVWRHYIKKDYRGKGLGTSLINEAEKFAKQHSFKYVYLHTQRTIPGSLEYWLAKDFQITFEANDDLKTVHLEKILSN